LAKGVLAPNNAAEASASGTPGRASEFLIAAIIRRDRRRLPSSW
jgi:hypothetical protein